MSLTKEAVEEILEDHGIECTGLGEVTCRGCRELRWMSWQQYNSHLADLIVALVPKGYPGADGSPVGQCGVTSAWLHHRLNRDHGIATQYCVGIVWVNNHWSREHVWLEIPDTERTVLDITADQLGLEQVVCDSRLELTQRGVHYTCTKSRSNTPDDAVTSRLRLLEAAL